MPVKKAHKQKEQSEIKNPFEKRYPHTSPAMPRGAEHCGFEHKKPAINPATHP